MKSTIEASLQSQEDPPKDQQEDKTLDTSIPSSTLACPPSPVANKSRSCNDLVIARAVEQQQLQEQYKPRAKSQRLSAAHEQAAPGGGAGGTGTGTGSGSGGTSGTGLRKPSMDATAADLQDEGDACDHLAMVANTPGMDAGQCIRVAMRFLQQCQRTCATNDTTSCNVSKDTIDHLLEVFHKALTCTTLADNATKKGVEQELKQLFVSHANVFDDKVQNFIMQNYIHESDDAANLRDTLRRKSIVRRCLQAMYPSRNSIPKVTVVLDKPSEQPQPDGTTTSTSTTPNLTTAERLSLGSLEGIQTQALPFSSLVAGTTGHRDEQSFSSSASSPPPPSSPKSGGSSPVSEPSSSPSLPSPPSPTSSSASILTKESVAQLKQRKLTMSKSFLSSLAASPLASLSPKTAEQVQHQLTHLAAWDFDLFQLSQAVPGQVLVLVGNELFSKYEIPSLFRTSQRKILEFLQQIQAKYHPHPYHNAEHAADVAQSLHHFFACGGLGSNLPVKTKAIGILAAVVHDLGHTGFSNNFHISCNDDLAIQYVYRSPLEHMHCAITFQLMKNPRCDLLSGLTKVQQQEIRNLMADLVLATDNSVHSVYLGKLEALVHRAASDATWRVSEPEDEKTLLQMALHAADVANPAKPIKFGIVWAERIMQEFYKQGDRERELQLPVSVGCDRENPIPIEKIQAGFIIGIARPLFNLICQLPDVQLAHCIQFLDENLVYWQHQILQTMPPAAMSSSSSASPPAVRGGRCDSASEDEAEAAAAVEEDSEYEEEVETVVNTEASELLFTTPTNTPTTNSLKGSRAVSHPSASSSLDALSSSSGKHHQLPR